MLLLVICFSVGVALAGARSMLLLTLAVMARNRRQNGQRASVRAA